MTEEQYLLELERLLMGMSVIDRVDVLRDVSEYFTSGRLDGKTDEMMIKELGTPEMLASELLVSVEALPTAQNTEAAVIKSPNVAFQNVFINVQNAHVNVLPSQDGYAYATLEAETDHGVKMDIVGNTLEVKIEYERRFWLSELFSWFGSKTPVLNVELPQHTYQTVRLNNRHGSSDIQSVSADTIDVESENGRVTASYAQAKRGSLQSSNGQISLSASTGQLWEVRSSNGKVEVLDLTTEQVNVQSSNGRIDLKNVTGRIDAKTSNGRIDCAIESIEHPLRLKTSNGRIDLHLGQTPEDVSMRAKTRNGKVEILGDRANERTFGNGAVEVILTSSNGSITVH